MARPEGCYHARRRSMLLRRSARLLASCAPIVLAAMSIATGCASGTDAPTCSTNDTCVQVFGPGAFCNAARVCERGTAPIDATIEDLGTEEGGTVDEAGIDAGPTPPPVPPPPPVDMGPPPPVPPPPPIDMGTPEMDAGPPPPPMDMGTPAMDTGPRDTGPTDTGPRDTGPVDTGPRDMGTTTDAGPSTAPPPGSIVINELDYDQLGTDTAELVELYNTTGAAIRLEGLSLYLFNCASADAPSEYTPSPIALAGMIPARGYAVIAAPGVGPAFSATIVRVDVPGMMLQNGGARAGDPGDGVALIHVTTGTAIDVVAYENRCGMTRIAGRDIPLTEGTATTAADSNDAMGSLSRMPNGTDTADNARDFAFTATATPGEANR